MTDDPSVSNSGLIDPKWCGVVAAGLILAHILSVLGMAYQAPLSSSADYKTLVNFFIWLSPIIVLLLFRKTCALVCTLAVPVSTIFVARAYYAYQKYSLGTNLAGQKGDWAWWLATFMGVASVSILSLWMLYRIAVLFGKFVSSRL